MALSPTRARSWTWLIPALVLVAAFVADAVSTRDAVPAAVVVLAAFVASALLGTVATAGISVLVVIAGAVLLHTFDHADASRFWSRVIFIVLCAALAVVLAEVRVRRERMIREQQFMSGLQTLTSRLLGARTLRDVAAVACDHCTPLLGASIARMSLVTEQRMLEVVAECGAPEGWRASVEVVPIDDTSASARVFTTNQPLYYRNIDEYFRQYDAWMRAFRATTVESMAVVPLGAGSTVFGVLALFFEDRQPFDVGQRAFIADVVGEIGAALERARLTEFESDVVAAMQSTLLGPPVLVEGIGHEARYLPANTELSVGGDWYDAQRLPDGRVSVCVGDVVGRGLAAAAVMGQLRSALAGCALDIVKPAEALDRLDRFARRIPGAMATTVAFALVDTEHERIEYASAGHLPPALVSPEGEVTFLADAQNFPLATAEGVARRDATTSFVAGSTVVFFTDGLVERRGESIDAGLERLADSLRRNWKLPLDMLCDTLTRELVPETGRSDDLALVVLRSPVTSPALFLRKMRASPEMLMDLRTDLRAWLDATPLDDDTAEGMVVAIGEACSNVIEHAYGDETGLVRVELSNLGDAVLASVCDTGAWKDSTQRDARGNGLPIMRAVVDEVRVTRRRSGTAVVLRTACAGDRDTEPVREIAPVAG